MTRAAELTRRVQAHEDAAIAAAEAGEPERALAEARAALELARELVALEPDPSGPEGEALLAHTLDTLACRLAETEDYEEALAVSKEACRRVRALARRDPARFEARLALALVNLGAGYVELGRPAEAVEPTYEAVELYRGVRERSEGAGHAADYARALSNLGLQLGAAGRESAALAPLREAAGLLGELAAERPQEFEAELAALLDNLASQLSLLDHEEEALEVLREAAASYRRLMTWAREPARAKLLRVLDKLARRCGRQGEHEEAVAHGAAQIELLRALPDREAELGGALEDHGVELSQIGRHEQALAATREAAAIWRARGAALELAHALHNLTQDLLALGRPREALAAASERVALLAELAEAEPEEHRPGLLDALGDLALDLLALTEPERAEDRAREAVALARALVEEDPLQFEPELAHALDVRGAVEAARGRHADARASFEEGLELLHPHHEREPELHQELLDELVADLSRV